MNLGKDITIITSNKLGPGVLSFSDAARRLDYTTSVFVVGKDDAVSALQNAQHILYRISPKTYPLYVALLDSTEGVKKDGLQAALNAFDKIKTHKLLTKASVAAPNTWIVDSSYIYNGEPFVIKIPRGNQGKGVELIKNDSDLRSFFDTYAANEQFVAQEFITEAVSRDKRLIVAGDKVIAAMERRSTTEDFRANLHLGGEGAAYQPTAKEIELAIRATDAFGLPYGGVDIIDSAHGPLVLEVNPSPGFGISEITGVDVAYEILKHILGVKND